MLKNNFKYFAFTSNTWFLQSITLITKQKKQTSTLSKKMCDHKTKLITMYSNTLQDFSGFFFKSIIPNTTFVYTMVYFFHLIVSSMKHLLNCMEYIVLIVPNWPFDVFGECSFIKIYKSYVKADNYYDVTITLWKFNRVTFYGFLVDGYSCVNQSYISNSDDVFNNHS